MQFPLQRQITRSRTSRTFVANGQRGLQIGNEAGQLGKILTGFLERIIQDLTDRLAPLLGIQGLLHIQKRANGVQGYIHLFEGLNDRGFAYGVFAIQTVVADRSGYRD